MQCIRLPFIISVVRQLSMMQVDGCTAAALGPLSARVLPVQKWVLACAVAGRVAGVKTLTGSQAQGHGAGCCADAVAIWEQAPCMLDGAGL